MQLYVGDCEIRREHLQDEERGRGTGTFPWLSAAGKLGRGDLFKREYVGPALCGGKYAD